MTIDVSRQPNLKYAFLERWDVDGHEVAMMLIEGPNDIKNRHLLCECDFPEDPNKPIVFGGPGDPHSCPAKKHIRAKAMVQACDRYRPIWNKMVTKDAVLDIFNRIRGGEYLGEHTPGIVYTQEVSMLLCLGQESVRNACDALYAEEKLELNGAILCEFVPRFRFPLEMEQTIAYVVEEPLGWPNGDAGMFALAEIEGEIEERTGCKSGKAGFGKHFPRIERKILLPAFGWLASELNAAAKSKRKRSRLRALSADEITKDFKWFPLKYPEIKVEFYAEFVKALLKTVFQNIPLERSMNKKSSEAKILRYWADFFSRHTKSFKKM